MKEHIMNITMTFDTAYSLRLSSLLKYISAMSSFFDLQKISYRCVSAGATSLVAHFHQIGPDK